MPPRQHDGRARHFARKLQKRDNRTGERNCANGNAKAHFNAADGQDFFIGIENAERFGIQIGCNTHQHSRQADKRVKCGHKLGHIGHRDFARSDNADDSANANGRQNLAKSCEIWTNIAVESIALYHRHMRD